MIFQGQKWVSREQKPQKLSKSWFMLACFLIYDAWRHEHALDYSYLKFQGQKWDNREQKPQKRGFTCLFILKKLIHACMLDYIWCMNMLQIRCICNFKVKNEFAMIKNPRNEGSHVYLFSEIRFMHACLNIYDAWMHEHALN